MIPDSKVRPVSWALPLPANVNGLPQMASTGICPNTTGCTLGYRKEPIELGSDARCPECGTPLQPSMSGAAGGSRGRLWPIVSVVGLFAVVCTLLVVVLLRQSSHHPAPDVSPTPASASAPVTSPSNAGNQKTVPRSSTTQTPASTSVRSQPHAEPDVRKRTPERDAVRKQVLERIDRMPNITEQQRDVLYAQLQHAQGFGRMATIGFDAGQNQLTADEIAAFEEALQHPRIRKLLSNPSVILVVLGFADAVESPDAAMVSSAARAESVASVLRQQADVLNVIHTVGMGNSRMFGSAPEQNRVTEVWAVLP
jgi:outer membrane protein OmpA-like peptidoglycan-associated protein